MEHLFTTDLDVDGRKVTYRVVFDHEKYSFLAHEGMAPELQSFSLKREHDEWHEEEVLPEQTKAQAIDALEKYLLRQH